LHHSRDGTHRASLRVFFGEECDCVSNAAGSSRPADAVDVRRARQREIKVDHGADGGEIHPSCHQIRGAQAVQFTYSEQIDDGFAFLIGHV